MIREKVGNWLEGDKKGVKEGITMEEQRGMETRIGSNQ
jgi:hypothetical protein